MNRYYKIKVEKKEKEGIVTRIEWKKKEKQRQDEGVYFIRTSILEGEEQLVWDIYNTIREIEATFRVLKTDLDLRPMFHQTDENIAAHIHLCLVAYMLVNTIRYRLKKKGIHHDWTTLVRIMNMQKVETVGMKGRGGKRIEIRVCSEPTVQVRAIYEAMGYRAMPF